ncbi:MAG: single-stranded DNA-binding protein [Cytophagales bacterium]|nr:single-stranded DNA-binding protein [Cytophagales bacterium]
MGSISKTILIGRVGKDPELLNTTNSKVAKISLATEESYIKKDSNEKMKKTEWHNVEVWGLQADIVMKYVKKGDQFGVIGKNITSSYEKNGEKHYRTVVRADEITLLGSKE